METTADPEVREADKRVEHARHSLSSRIDEIGRRFRSVKRVVDLEAQVKAHPWSAVGAGFALGVIAGLAHSRERDGKHTFGGLVLAGAGAVVTRLVKSYAAGQIAVAARSWIDERTMKSDASRDKSIEAFLEH